MRFVTFISCVLIACAPLAVIAQSAQPAPGPVAKALQPYMDNHEFAGAVTLIASKDKVLDVETMGYSDLSKKVPMKADAEFWIASMSKALTTTCMMMLVDEGKVKLDDPVEKYLPQFKNERVLAAPPVADLSAAKPDENGYKVKPPKPGGRQNGTEPTVPVSHPITIREIMSHTAGFPGRSRKEVGAVDVHPLSEQVDEYAAEALQYQPGTQFFYSNEGINTAGRIVEIVSGMPLETFMQKRLFDPLGMKDTTFWPTKEQQSRLAKTYNLKDGQLVEEPIHQLTYPLEQHGHRFPVPAGGLFSTAADVGRFCQMLLNNGTLDGKQILSPESVHALTHKETPASVKTTYGFGMYEMPDGWRHGGAFKTEMDGYTDHGVISIFMIQISHPYKGNDQELVEKAMANAAAAMAPAQ